MITKNTFILGQRCFFVVNFAFRFHFSATAHSQQCFELVSDAQHSGPRRLSQAPAFTLSWSLCGVTVTGESGKLLMSTPSGWPPAGLGLDASSDLKGALAVGLECSLCSGCGAVRTWVRSASDSGPAAMHPLVGSRQRGPPL